MARWSPTLVVFLFALAFTQSVNCRLSVYRQEITGVPGVEGETYMFVDDGSSSSKESPGSLGSWGSLVANVAVTDLGDTLDWLTQQFTIMQALHNSAEEESVTEPNLGPADSDKAISIMKHVKCARMQQVLAQSTPQIPLDTLHITLPTVDQSEFEMPVEGNVDADDTVSDLDIAMEVSGDSTDSSADLEVSGGSDTDAKPFAEQEDLDSVEDAADVATDTAAGLGDDAGNDARSSTVTVGEFGDDLGDADLLASDASHGSAKDAVDSLDSTELYGESYQKKWDSYFGSGASADPQLPQVDTGMVSVYEDMVDTEEDGVTVADYVPRSNLEDPRADLTRYPFITDGGDYPRAEEQPGFNPDETSAFGFPEPHHHSHRHHHHYPPPPPPPFITLVVAVSSFILGAAVFFFCIRRCHVRCVNAKCADSDELLEAPLLQDEAAWVEKVHRAADFVDPNTKGIDTKESLLKAVR